MSNESQNQHEDPLIPIPASLLYEHFTFAQREQRANRRYRFFGFIAKCLFYVGIIVAGYMLGEKALEKDGSQKLEPHVASISINGAIGPNTEKLVPIVRKAFQNQFSRAIVLRVNSPGGSPVQADRLYSEILELKKAYPHKKVYVVVEDLAASAAYYISTAADEIWVNKNSLVGSIGVISSGFGFQEIMEKVGVERRVMTSGKNKAILDPFLPLRPDLKEYWENLLHEVHGYFIDSVKKGRGDRLKSDNPDLFSGLIWSGVKAIELGLADKEGSVFDVSRLVLDGKVNVVDYSPMPNFLGQIGASASAEVSDQFKEAMQNLANQTVQLQ